MSRSDMNVLPAGEDVGLSHAIGRESREESEKKLQVREELA